MRTAKISAVWSEYSYTQYRDLIKDIGLAAETLTRRMPVKIGLGLRAISSVCVCVCLRGWGEGGGGGGGGGVGSET